MERLPQPWIKWDGLGPPNYIHLIRYELLLKNGRVRFCDIGQAVIWENFGGGSDIEGSRTKNRNVVWEFRKRGLALSVVYKNDSATITRLDSIQVRASRALINQMENVT